MWCDNFEGLDNRGDDPYVEIELPPAKPKRKQADVEIALKLNWLKVKACLFYFCLLWRIRLNEAWC